MKIAKLSFNQLSYLKSPKTYLELFLPIERYAISQYKQGDCYMLAPVDSLIQNPYTRDRIYEVFKENKDGSVDMCFSGFIEQDGEIVQKDPGEF